MATYKVVDADQLNADMTSVADSIRTKGGTTEALAWPDGYKTAIDSIPASGVQSDWNQNDSTASDYVKNRPFYTVDAAETVLVEESTVSFADSGGVYVGEFPSTFSATVGETYKVYWDGTAYKCTCVNFNDRPAIGNRSVAGVGSDTGEPFFMSVFNGSGIMIYAADTAASHTISISKLGEEVVHQIPLKYISAFEGNAIILPSSTENSTKKFRITVDDSGALTATEVT